MTESPRLLRSPGEGAPDPASVGADLLPADAWVSFALVMPYALPWRSWSLSPSIGKRTDPRTHPGVDEATVSALKEFRISRLSWSPALFDLDPHSSTYRHWFEPKSYFASPRIGGIATAHSGYQFWTEQALPADEVRTLRRLGLQVMAVERHEFGAGAAPCERLGGGFATASDEPFEEQMGFAVVHLRLTSPEPGGCIATRDLETVAQCLRRPTEDYTSAFNGLLKACGLDIEVTPGGFVRALEAGEEHAAALAATQARVEPTPCWGPHHTAEAKPPRAPRVDFRWSPLERRLSREGDPAERFPGPWDSLERHMTQVFVMTCIDTDLSRLASPSSLADLSGWDTASRWMHVLATGFSRDSGFIPPSDDRLSDNLDAAEGNRRLFSMSSVSYRASRTGLVVNPDERLRAARTYQGDMAADGAPIAYPQSAQIRALAHGRYLDLVMLATRQYQWLDKHAERLAQVYRAPGTDEAEVTLQRVLDSERRINWFHNQRWFREIPSRRDATALLSRLQDRLGSPEDFAELREEQAALRQIALLETEQERRRVDAGAAEAKERETRRRNRNRESLEFLAAVIAPPSLILSAAAVIADPNWTLFGGAVCLSLFFIWLAFRGLRNRRLWDLTPAERRQNVSWRREVRLYMHGPGAEDPPLSGDESAEAHWRERG